MKIHEDVAWGKTHNAHNFSIIGFYGKIKKISWTANHNDENNTVLEAYCEEEEFRHSSNPVCYFKMIMSYQ